MAEWMEVDSSCSQSNWWILFILQNNMGWAGGSIDVVELIVPNF